MWMDEVKFSNIRVETKLVLKNFLDLPSFRQHRGTESCSTPLTHFLQDSTCVIDSTSTSPSPLLKGPEHPLAFLESSLKKFWATPMIASSGSISRVAISLTWPFTFTMSLRIRWVITSAAVCLTLGQGSRNLREKHRYCRKQLSISMLPIPMTAYSTAQGCCLPALAPSDLASWTIFTL